MKLGLVSDQDSYGVDGIADDEDEDEDADDAWYWKVSLMNAKCMKYIFAHTIYELLRYELHSTVRCCDKDHHHHHDITTMVMLVMVMQVAIINFHQPCQAGADN